MKQRLFLILSILLASCCIAQPLTKQMVESFVYEVDDHFVEYSLNEQQKEWVKLGNIGVVPDAKQVCSATIRFNFISNRTNRYKNYKAYIDYNVFTKEGRVVIISEDRLGRDETELYRMLKHFCALYQSQLGQVAPKYKWWPEQPISRIGQISIKFILLF